MASQVSGSTQRHDAFFETKVEGRRFKEMLSADDRRELQVGSARSKPLGSSAWC